MPAAQASHGSLTRLTLLSVGGLVAGVVGGLLLRAARPDAVAPALELATAVVRAWTNAFRLLVLPLVVTQLYLAVTSAALPRGGVGRMALTTPLVFAGLLLGTAALSVAATLELLRLPWLSGLSITGIPASSTALPQALPADASVGGWVDSVVPPNLVAVAATDNILPAMLFALVFGLAARRLAAEYRQPIDRAAGGINQVTFILVDWLLLFMPLVVLALGLQGGATSGLRIGALLVGFVVTETIVLVIAIVALLPVTALIGRLRPVPLIRAMWPVHLTAATTRSSLATIPALLAAAGRLGLPEPVSGAVIPLAGATLKLSRTVASPAKLLFLAHVLGLGLTPQQVVVFTATILLLSPSTVGVPRVASGSRSLPAYVAAGIPAEYVVLLGSTTWLTDSLQTVLNSTGYQAANVLVARASGWLTVPGATPEMPLTGKRSSDTGEPGEVSEAA